MKIGIFDSGIGGLTVYNKLKSALPGYEYIYFGDRINAPYGDKSPDEIKFLTNKIITFLKDSSVDAIVVACNTIVANAMDDILSNCPIPVIGVIDPVIEAMKESGYKKIGLAATRATIDNGIYQIRLKGNGIETVAEVCNRLVPLIESGNNGHDMDMAIDYHFSNFVGKDLDALVLGCTHFPIIQDKIKSYMESKGERIDIINPANFVSTKLKNLAPSRSNTLHKSDKFVFSKTADLTKATIEGITGRNVCCLDEIVLT